MIMNLIQKAFELYGLKEISGEEDNELIINMAHEIGLININDDETPWCMTAQMWVNKQCKVPYLCSAIALDGLNLEEEIAIEEAVPGNSMVILYREGKNSGKGHIGVFLGFSYDSKKVFIIGGNQSNMYKISAYDVSDIAGIRLMTKEALEQVPDPIIKYNDKGDNVKMLQKCLNILNFNAGIEDGIFGNGTELALRKFQAENNLIIDGIYGSQCKMKLTSKLQE